MRWMWLGLCVGLVAGGGSPAGGQDVVLDISTEADARRLLPASGPNTKALAGRGGLKARSAQAPGGGAATLIGGAVDGSLYNNATHGDLLMPGSGYQGFKLEPNQLGRGYTLQYEVYLGADHGVGFMSLATRFIADLDGNQIIKFEDPGNEFKGRVETFNAVKGPDLNVVDEWQTISANGTVPATDNAGLPIGQMNLSLNVGPTGTPRAQVWIRNIRLTLDEPAEADSGDPSEEGAAGSEPTPPAEEEPQDIEEPE